MLKKFQMGRYKFQVGVGGKTWQCKTAFFNLGWSSFGYSFQHFKLIGLVNIDS